MSLPNCPIAASAFLCLLLIGCESAPDESETEPEPTDRWQPQMDTAEVYDVLGVAIPDDVNTVTVVTWPVLWDALGNSLLPLANPDAAPGEVGTVDGVRDEIATLWQQRYGFDAAQIEGAVVAMDDDLRGAVLLAELQPPDDAETVEIGDHQGFRVSATLGNIIPASGYVAPIEAQQPAFAYAEDVDELRRMLDAAALYDAPPEERELTQMMQLTEGARVASATTTNLVERLPYVDVENVPERGVVSLGNELRMTAFGDDDALEATSKDVEKLFDQLMEKMSDAYDSAHNDGPGVGMLHVYGYHGLAGIAAQLDPQFGDGRLDYTVHVDGGLLSVVLSLSAIATAHYLADMAGADLAPVGKHHYRTAEMEIDQLRQMVETYYVTNDMELPDTLEDLTKGSAPMTSEIPKDPWGNDYVYEVQGERDFTIFSPGRDGQPGTAEDVRVD